MQKQIFNPYLPSWEYIPDGEPHVFGDRVYIYGSHDFFNGSVFCLGDYVCYSAPVNNLKEWKYEGVIFKKSDDPINAKGRMVLYAPDVTQGSDGRYYIYYVYDKVNVVSVAVCDTPCGKFEFYGYVHYQDGTRLGEKKGDMPQFDPAVLTEGNKTYLYTAFCGNKMKDRIGAMATVLDSDMLTIIEEPVVIAPGDLYSLSKDELNATLQKNMSEVENPCTYKLASTENWAGFKNHEFFEASSIRKIKDTYYFVYSSAVMHELCYATSKSPTKDFVYQGVIVSNCDLNIDSYKPATMPCAYGANNHGGIENINGEWYIFYHRHTNNTWYSRQGCAEKIQVLDDGSILQVELTSCGLNGSPLVAKGTYPAYIACNLFTDKMEKYVGKDFAPRVTQDGGDLPVTEGSAQKNETYIANITNNVTMGFKYFDFKGVKEVCIATRGYIYGDFEVKTKWDGEVFGKIKVESTNFWEENKTLVSIPDGVHALYLTFKGTGCGQLKSFSFN